MIALRLPVSECKNSEVDFLCSYVLTLDPCGGPVLTPGASYNKRAMMALDRSPESFSPQMNSTSLFLWFPTCDP